MSDLATVLGAFFGSAVRREDAWLYGVATSDAGFFNARVRMDPVAELIVTPRALDGFELTLRGERLRPGAVFEQALTMSTNDHALAHVWLDDVTRATVLDSAYEFESHEFTAADFIDRNYTPGVTTLRRIWTYELANDELFASKGAVEHQPERIATVLKTACTIASRCRRWAAEYAPLAERMGAKLASEVALGGAPVVTSNRAAVEVTLQLLRRLPGERSGRLRTPITAKRVGLHDERSFSLVSRSARRTMVPPLPDGSRRDFGLDDYQLRSTAEASQLDELATKQLAAASPGAVIADLDSIDVWFDGAPMEPDRLEAAFALASHLAIGAAAQHGPYR